MSSYMGNIVNSARYFIEDVAADYVPAFKPIKENISKIAQHARATFANGGIKSMVKTINRLPYYQEMSDITGGIFKGFTSGKIYTRYGADLDAQFGMTNFDMIDSDEKDLSVKGKDVDEGPVNDTPTIGDKMVTQATFDASKASTESTIRAQSKMHIDNRIFFTGLKEEIGGQLQNTNDALSALANFNNNVMKQFVDNSIKYYETTTSLLTDIRNASMPQKAEAQTNMGRDKNWKELMNSGDIMGALKAMGREGLRSVDSGGWLGFLNTFLQFTLPIYAQAPGQIFKDVFTGFMDSKFKLGGLKELQEKFRMGEMFQSLFQAGRFSDNKLMRKFSEALLPKNQGEYSAVSRTTFDPKKDVKWDLESKMALTVVIPQYLSTIASSLTGFEEKFYDMEDNAWRTRKELDEKARKLLPTGEKDTGEEIIRTLNMFMRDDVKHKVGADKNKKEILNSAIGALAKGLIAGSFNMDAIANMGFEKKEYGGKNGFMELMGIEKDSNEYKYFKANPEIISVIKDAYMRAMKDESGRKRLSEIDNRILDIGKTDRAKIANIEAKEISSGFIYAKNNGLMGGNEMPLLLQNKLGFDPDSKLKSLLAPYGDTSSKLFYNEADRAKKMKFMDIPGLDHEAFIEGSSKDAFWHSINRKLRGYVQNNETLDEYFKNDDEYKKAVYGGDVASLDDMMKNSQYNPILDFIKKKVKDDIDEATEGKLDEKQNSEISKVLGAQSEDIKKELEAVDKNTSLSDAEKTKEKNKIMKRGTAYLMAGVSSLFKGSKFFQDSNANGNMKSIAKIVGIGVGGILGANAFGQLLKIIPGMGSVIGATGWLAPMMLTGLGLAGSVYAAKTGLLSNLMGDLKDPSKRKEMISGLVKKGLPDLFLGGGTAIASSLLLKSILPFGGVLGPVMGAAMGLATGIYSHRSGLMANLFGVSDERKDKNDHAGQLNRNRWFNYAKNTLAATVGMAGSGMLLKAMGGLPGIGSLFSLGGGIISNPILFATGAVASGILLEKDNIKKRIFGDGAEKNSFTKNLFGWLFGDKESGKEGILSRQMKKLGGFLDSGTEKMSKWFKESIVGNVKLGFKPFTDKMSDIGKGIIAGFMGGWDKLSDKMRDSMDKGFIKSLATSFEEKVINPLSSKIGGFFNFFFKWSGKLIASPFKMFANIFAGREYDPEKDADPPSLSEEIAASEKRRKEKKEELNRKKEARKENKNASLRSAIFGKGGPKRFARKGALSGTLARTIAERASFGMKPLSNIEKDEVSLLQTDSQIANAKIGDSTIKESGCAVVCMTKIIAHFKKDKEFSPLMLASFAAPYKVDKDGIKWEFFKDMAETLNLDFNRAVKNGAQSINTSSILKAIKKGMRIIVLVDKSYNESSRHYLYIKGVSGNNLIFDDPADGENKQMNVDLLNKLAIEYYIFNMSKKIAGLNIDNISAESANGIATIENGANSDKDSEEPESVSDIVRNTISDKVGSFVEDNLNAIGLGFLAAPLMNSLKSLMNIFKRKEDKEEEGNSEEEENSSEASEIEKLANQENLEARVEKPKDEKPVVDRVDTSNSNNETVKLDKDALKKTNEILENILKAINENGNGVAYNMEYIKRVMVKKFGDLEASDKPDSGTSFGKFLSKRYKGGFMGFLSGLFDFKESPVLKMFKNGFDFIGEKWIKPLFDFEKSPILKGIPKVFDKIFGGVFTTVGNMIEGVSTLFNKTIPKILDTAIVKPIMAVIDSVTHVFKEGVTMITEAIKGIGSAVSRIIGDLYEFTVGSASTLLKVGAQGLVGLTGMIFKGIGNSGFGKAVFGGLGKLIGGTLGAIGDVFGLTKLFSGIGSAMGKSWNSIMGPKKVYVAGGYIDIVKKVEGVGAVGVVDQDTYKAVNDSSKVESSIRDGAKTADGKKETTATTQANSTVQKSKSSSGANKDMKAADKEQDTRNDLQDNFFRQALEMFKQSSNASSASASKDKSKKSVDSDGDGIPDDQENNGKKSGIMATVLGTIGTLFGLKTGKKFGGKILSKIAEKIGWSKAKKMASTKMLSTGGKVLGLGKWGAGNLLKFATPILGATSGIGWGISKLGDGAKAVGFNGMGDALVNAGDGIATPGNYVNGLGGDLLANTAGINGPTFSEMGAQSGKFFGWQQLKHRYAQPKFANFLKKDLMKGTQGGLEATQNLLKNKNVIKYLHANGVKMSGTTMSEKAASVLRNKEASKVLFGIFNSEKVTKEISKRVGSRFTKEMAEELSKEVIKAGAKNLEKKAAIMATRTALNYIPYVNVIALVTFFLVDFGWGWYKAGEYMKVKKPTLLMKLTAGLVNAIQGTISSLNPLLLGLALIPTTIITQAVWKLMLKWFGDKNAVNDYMKQRNEYLADELKKMNKEKDKEKSKPMLLDKIKDESDMKGISQFKYTRGGTYSIVGTDVTKHDYDIVQKASIAAIMGNEKAKSGADWQTMSKVVTSRNNNNLATADQRNWFVKALPWSDTFKLSTDALLESTRFREDLANNDSLDSQTLSQSKGSYKIAGYRYDEVGCGPEALWQVYKAFGINVDVKHLAKVASYYKQYIESGQGIPFKYIIDYAVFDGLTARFVANNHGAISGALGAGYKAVILLSNPDGSSHYVSAVGQTTQQSIVIIDPLRKGAIAEGGKEGNIKKSVGQYFIKANDKKFWGRVQFVAIIGAGVTSSDFGNKEGKWFRLYPKAKDIIKSKPNSFKWEEIGSFMDAQTMFEARMFADPRLNQQASNDKPTNYDIFDKYADSLIKQYNLSGRYSRSDIKEIMMKDIVNNGVSNDKSFVVFKDAAGKGVIGLTRSNSEGRIYGGKFGGMKGYNKNSGELTLYDEKSGSQWKTKIDPNTNKVATWTDGKFGGEARFETSPQYLLPTSFGKDNAGFRWGGDVGQGGNGDMYGAWNSTTGFFSHSVAYDPAAALKNSSLIRVDDYNKYVEDAGGYGSSRPSFITAKARENVDALNKRIDKGVSMLKSTQNKMQQSSVKSDDEKEKVIIHKTADVIKTEAMEKELSSINAKFDKLIELMGTFLAVSSNSKNNIVVNNNGNGSSAGSLSAEFISEINSFLK